MINSDVAQTTYIVENGRADYPIGFVYYTNASDNTPQIKVCLNKRYPNPLEYGVDYSLSEDGLSIVLASPVVGDRVDIMRNVPMTQTSDYVIGRIDPDQIERDFDLAVMREQQNKNNINNISEVPEDHEIRIEALEDDVDNLESLVPTQATELNQLADKDFVNSSIATSTATFRGTYSSLADLEAVTADDNDYGFVESVDSAGNTLYNRYKYTTSTTPASWVFEYALNNSSFTAAQWAAINSGITANIVEHLDVPTGRNVGDIFWTMRTDSSLNGAVECNGAQYSISDFSGGESIGVLLENNKVPYMSLSDYATALAADGSVGVFGWDGAGTSVFRVPSLNDVFVETGTAAQLGDFVPAGLPNITGSWSNLGRAAQAGSGAVAVTQQNIGNRDYEAGYGGGNYTFDASRSSAIYGSSNTVQPNAVRYRAMVQLAVSATDEAVETCTGVLADVAELKYDYVVDFQAPTAQNNYTWYRKYKSGWVEQGGIASVESSSWTPVLLPVEMADTNYGIQATCGGAGGGTYVQINESGLSTTQISIGGSQDNTTARWEVKGMAAQS